MRHGPDRGGFQARPTPEERRALLASAIRTETRAGWRLRARTDYRAVLARRRTGSVPANITLSVVTAGLWLPVWGLLVLVRDERQLVISVDEWGFVMRTER
jgi:hypothetical protein